MEKEFFELRLRVRISAEGINDATEKAQGIVEHLNEQTHLNPSGEVFGSIYKVGVVEVIPTVE